MRLVSVPCSASKVFPCQPKMLIRDAVSALRTVPGAMMAVPCASPLGMSPAGLLEKRSSSSFCDIARSCAVVYAIAQVPPCAEVCCSSRRLARSWKVPLKCCPLSLQRRVLSMARSMARRSAARGPISRQRSVEYFVTRWFVMRDSVHIVPQLRKHPIHSLSGPALIPQRTMLGDTVPWVVRKPLFKLDLRRGVEFLPRYAQCGCRYARGKPFRPEHGVVFNGHPIRIGLQL